MICWGTGGFFHLSDSFQTASVSHQMYQCNLIQWTHSKCQACKLWLLTISYGKGLKGQNSNYQDRKPKKNKNGQFITLSNLDRCILFRIDFLLMRNVCFLYYLENLSQIIRHKNKIIEGGHYILFNFVQIVCTNNNQDHTHRHTVGEIGSSGPWATTRT